MRTFLDSDLDVDRYLIDAWKEVFGLDLRNMPLPPDPESVWNYVDEPAPGPAAWRSPHRSLKGKRLTLLRSSRRRPHGGTSSRSPGARSV